MNPAFRCYPERGVSAHDPQKEQLYAAIRAGNVLADKYRVDSTLGVGGFGIVLAATHVHLDEKVAIKLLLPEAAQNPEAVARFLREAKAAVKIRGEHVARVTDVGTLPMGLPYMVMEYLDGQDLSVLVKSSGGQAVPHVVEWVLQSLEAIAEAHAAGMVHRDLKPANLFLTRRPDGTAAIKVLDFGISKVSSLNPEDKGMTKTSDVMGSPYYMSPEQMKSTRDVDARTDIWALGTILYEMLGGQPPFDGETMPALLANILQEPPRNLCELRPDVPPELWAVIYKCLEKRPDDRFSNVAELAAALAPFGPPTAHRSVDRVRGILGHTAPPAAGSNPGLPHSAVPQASPSGPGISSGPYPAPGVSTAGAVPHAPPGAVSGAVHPAVSAASASWGNTVGSPPAKSKTPLAIGIGAVALVLGAIGAVVALGVVPTGSDDPSAAGESAANAGEPDSDGPEPDGDTAEGDAPETPTAVAAGDAAEDPPDTEGDADPAPTSTAAGSPPATATKPPAASTAKWKPPPATAKPPPDKTPPPPPPPAEENLFGGQD